LGLGEVLQRPGGSHKDPMEEAHHKQDPLRNQGQRRSHLQPQQEPQVEEHTTVACSHRRCRQRVDGQ
jgi:hypothetical protein